MDTINTLTKGKKMTCYVLIGLLVILVVMGIHDVRSNNYLFIFIGVIYFILAVKYLRSYYQAFETIAFSDSGMVLSKKGKEVTVSYVRVLSLKEVQLNFIEIDIGEKKYLVHGEFHQRMAYEDTNRTINRIRDMIQRKYKKNVQVQYK